MFLEALSKLRGDVGAIGDQVKALMHEELGVDLSSGAVAEIKANIMLSYRHLEDARMRLGKAMQAKDGGISVYDK